MDFGFVTWWFEKHYIWSTLLTPGMTLAWCFYKGLVWRGIIAGFLTAVLFGRMCGCGGGKPGGGWKCGKEKKEEGA